MKFVNVVGARPNFMKMAPIIEALEQQPSGIDHLLVHTGQHYDEKMSKAFFDDLGMPVPDINLEIGSGTHAEQTSRIMVEFEKVCLKEQPDLVIVVGDVNSTMACTITAKKLGIRVAHVEAGLRSRDMTMPEEINRLCTDILCDYLFTTEPIANENLIKEGVAPEKIFFVGNVMIDTLLKHKEMASRSGTLERLDLKPGEYATLTMHRPSNVDDGVILEGILQALKEISRTVPIIFPIHPRTRKMAQTFGLSDYFTEGGRPQGIWLTEPLGYLDFLQLTMNSRLVLTDSGGLQEETTVLGVPCITMRYNTERPITCSIGTNVLVGSEKDKILAEARQILNDSTRKGAVPEKWDGQTAKRIVKILKSRGKNDISKG